MHLPSCAFCKELRNSAAASERDKGFVFWLRVSRMKKSEMHGLLVSDGISLLFYFVLCFFIISIILGTQNQENTVVSFTL